MKSFQEIEPAELERIEGGAALVIGVVVGAILIGGAAAFAYGYSQGKSDCPLTPK
jgi:lactobin A/cerein 7B family class IIb bacteriocin